jgi:hypothetical protein
MQLVFYADAAPREIAKRLGLRSVELGWNVEILTPPDEGVFYRRRRVSPGDSAGGEAPGLGRYITNDIYIYLDLWAHPARGKEQADHLLEVIASEPPHRPRSTEEEARFQKFLKLRDRAHTNMRGGKWEEAASEFERALKEVKDLTDLDAIESRERELFFSWLTLEHLLRETWEKDRKRRDALLKRFRWEIPGDDEVLRRFPPFRMNHALVRYLLGTRHAILAAGSQAGEQDHQARIAVQHFKIAISPYTEGASTVVADVEKVCKWLRKVAEVDLVL